MRTVQELENKLSKPSTELIQDLTKIDGDILILGLGGKMGPSLAKLAKRAIDKGKLNKKIIGVSRFSNTALKKEMEDFGIETISGDLLNIDFVNTLPKVENVIFMAGNKFGTLGNENYTWAMNVYLPATIADYFKDARIVAFSSGNIYPFMPVDSNGADESVNPSPIGEYAQSCLGRERMFEYFSKKNNTPVLIYRLNYALDLRYGVLHELATSVWNSETIDLTMGYVNVIWQGDANEYALRSLLHVESPAKFLNITGPQVISIEYLANQFAKKMNKKVQTTGTPSDTALLNDSSHAYDLMGKPLVSLDQMIDWTSEWVMNVGISLSKPTHFQERGGSY